MPVVSSWRALAAGLLGAFAIYAAEQMLPPGWQRSALASVAWLAFGLAAIAASLRAVSVATLRERLPWTFIAASSAAWTLGTLIRSAYLIAETPLPTPSAADVGYLGAAGLLILGF